MTFFDVPQLNPPYPGSGFAVAINNGGEVAGYIYPCFFCDYVLGFARSHQGNIETFTIPFGLQPTSINARGDITGYSNPYYLAVRGFVRDRNGEMTIFDVPEANSAGPHAYAASINNRGDIAGWFSVCAQDCRARGFVRDREGILTVFDATPNGGTTVASINERGDVVGEFSDVTYSSHQFLRDHKGHITVFDVPNGLMQRASV